MTAVSPRIAKQYRVLHRNTDGSVTYETVDAEGSELMIMHLDGSMLSHRVAGWCAPCWRARLEGKPHCDWPECSHPVEFTDGESPELEDRASVPALSEVPARFVGRKAAQVEQQRVDEPRSPRQVPEPCPSWKIKASWGPGRWIG
jgi:hypothetical protein